MRIEGLQQNTPEWIVHRIGMVTASRVVDVITKLKKGGYSAERKKYLTEKVVETLTGRASECFVSQAMEWGIETEPLAVAAYEMRMDVEAQDGGFWVHDSIPRFGASPDRLLCDDGILEAKCPTTAVHLEYLMAGVVPEEYQPQCLAEMACTGRQYVDFVSYDPRLPEKLRLLIVRFPRDEARILAMESEVKTFLEEVVQTLQRLASRDDLTSVLEQSVAEVK